MEKTPSQLGMNNLLVSCFIALVLLKSTFSFVNRLSRTKQNSRVTRRNALDPELVELLRDALKGASDFGAGASDFGAGAKNFGVGVGGLDVAAVGLLGFSIYQTSVSMESMRDEMKKDKANAKVEREKDKADAKVEMDKADKMMDKNKTDTQAQIDNNFIISTGLTVLSLVLSKLSASQVGSTPMSRVVRAYSESKLIREDIIKLYRRSCGGRVHVLETDTARSLHLQSGDTFDLSFTMHLASQLLSSRG
ncbi:hypothetical protein B484DRAFT_449144 [Ochromonadaceae sp. CCMP2298]|nr:hypothetical protein B484DRAFT_449144 [Ochromonadaceae sp. CCMP2298]|mmetsp:Transcript_10948/g.24286  ORF Transcript_10948/g.24286 Transcript_10948/m.24286 type:complete len:250 (+) Transcript_10948:138-887(+)